MTAKAFQVRHGFRVGSKLIINHRGEWVGSPVPPSINDAIQRLNDLLDVSAGSPTIGAILYNDGTNWLKLPRGTSGQVLTMGSPLLPAWQTAAAGGSSGSPNTHVEKAGSPITINTAGIADNQFLRIYDSGNTDYADFFHDGTNFNTTLTNTTEWVVDLGDGSTNFALERSDTGSRWRFNMAGDDLRIFNSGGAGSDILFSIDSGSSDTGNNVGIGDATPSEKLSVWGSVGVWDTGGTDNVIFSHDGTDINIAGTNAAAINFTGPNEYNFQNQYRVYPTLTRSVPTVVGDVIDIGTLAVNAGGFVVHLDVTVPDAGFSVSKAYIVPINYAETVNVWEELVPIADGGVYSGNNYAVDINVNINFASFRIRRTAGSTAGTASITMTVTTDNTSYSWTPSTATSTVGSPAGIVYYAATGVTTYDNTIDLVHNTNLIGGNTLTIEDSTGSDSIAISHNGTDASFAFTNTTDVNFTGAGTSYTFDNTIHTTGNRIEIEGASSRLIMNESGATANEGVWRFLASGDIFYFNALSDDELTSTDIWYVTRTGTTVDDFYFRNMSRVMFYGPEVRMYDGGLTDYAAFSHDGTNFNTAFTNTSQWNITNLGFLDLQDSAQLRIYGGGAGSPNSGVFTFNNSGSNMQMTSSTVNLQIQPNTLTQFLGGRSVRLMDADNSGYVDFRQTGSPFTVTASGVNRALFTGFQQIDLGNFAFDVDQTVGAGQDNYVLTYDNGTGQISLEAAAAGTVTSSSGADNRIAVFTNATNIEGDASFQWDASTATMSLYNTGDTNQATFQHDGTNFTLAGIGSPTTIQNFDMVNFGNAFRLRDGARFEIYDPTDSAYLYVNNDGTDVNWVGVGVTDFIVDGLTFFKIFGGLAVYDSTLADSGQFTHDGTDFNMAFENTTDLNIRDGVVLKVFDSGDTDSINFSHDGTNAITGFTNTAAWHIGADQATPTLVNNAGATFDFWTDGNTADSVHIIRFRDRKNASGQGADGQVMSFIASRRDSSGARAKLQFGVVNDDLSGDAKMVMDIDHTGRVDLLPISETEDALRIYNVGGSPIPDYFPGQAESVGSPRKGRTDYAGFRHDGTDFITTMTNTTDWNVTGLAGFNVGNYNFDVDQTVGAGQDNYVLTYDNADGQISLEPASGGGDAFLAGSPISTINANSFALNQSLRIYDSGNTDYAEFSHDGTDFNTAFTNTADWNITGLSSEMRLRGGASLTVEDGGSFSIFDAGNTDAVVMSHDGTNFNTTFTTTSLWEFDMAGLTSGVSYTEGANAKFFIDKANTIVDVRDGWSLRVRDSGDTDYADFNHDGTNFNFDFVNTSNVDMAGAAALQMLGGMDVDIRDAGLLRIRDTGDTDYVEFQHDGTDFNMTFTNVTDWNISDLGQNRVHFNSTAGGSRLHVGGDSTGYSVIVGQTQHGGSPNVLNYRAYFAYDSYWNEATNEWEAVRTSLGRKYMMDMGYHNNSVRFRRFDGTVTSPWADSAWTDMLTIDGGNARVDLGNGYTLRVSDSGDTDYVEFSHDGTDFNVVGTNTTSINFTSVDVEMAAGDRLAINWFQLSNQEQGTYGGGATPTSGTMYFDNNVANADLNGTPLATDSVRGGIVAYNSDDGWGLVLDTNNIDEINLSNFTNDLTTITVADESADTTCFPLFVTAATGALQPKTGSNMTFNSATGHFTATSKSFLIDHPTKPGHKLQYGSLEGPENGVYVRGRLTDDNEILLPDYWIGLVDADTITVQLTPIGSHQNLYVHEIVNNTVIVGGVVDCFYTVYGERKDVDKLIVEFE